MPQISHKNMVGAQTSEVEQQNDSRKMVKGPWKYNQHLIRPLFLHRNIVAMQSLTVGLIAISSEKFSLL
jgi:hypothetical protein